MQKLWLMAINIFQIPRIIIYMLFLNLLFQKEKWKRYVFFVDIRRAAVRTSTSKFRYKTKKKVKNLRAPQKNATRSPWQRQWQQSEYD